jgi:hypothetical protein
MASIGWRSSVMEREVTTHPEITSRAELAPIAVSIEKACELSGFGPTTIWTFLRDGRLDAVRVPGVRRTLVTYQSLAQLLVSSASPPPRRRGRPHNE